MHEFAHISDKLLLHACCGPCSMEPVRLLRERGVEPTIYYANSNIHPAEEYERRLETLSFWAQDERLRVVEGAYAPEAWEETVGRMGDAARAKFGVVIHEANDEPLADSNAQTSNASSQGCSHTLAISQNDKPNAEESTLAAGFVGKAPTAEQPPQAAQTEQAEQPTPTAQPKQPTQAEQAELARQARCRACYRMRFEETAQYALDHGFNAIGTTLSVSPYQYTAIIREELERAARRAGIDACFEDYRPYYDNATERSREAGMYRQNYCACRFSAEESQIEREERKRARKEAKAAEAAAHAEERQAEKAQRDAKRAEKAAYADKQARKRAILKQMREQAR